MGVFRGAGRSCLLAVELALPCLCVRRFPDGRVPRRRKVVVAGCRAGRSVPLRLIPMMYVPWELCDETFAWWNKDNPIAWPDPKTL